VSLLKLFKQQYLDEGGVKCPYCRSKDLKCKFITTNNGLAHQEINCCTCNKTWLDVYTLTNILTEN
jgi:transposase-like protein